MKLHFLGTSAGTEPRPGRHHASIAIELGDNLYWFDAGECCGYTAHIMGLPVLNTRKIFISHTHMDHIGGLANLLWYVRKLTMVLKTPKTDEIELCIPNYETYTGIDLILRNTERGFVKDFTINAHEFQDGIICDNGELKVTAFHNTHLPHSKNTPWRSFSFLIEAEDNHIVYSGDLGELTDILPLIKSGRCDILMIETGHYNADDVIDFIKKQNLKIGKLIFVHSGKEIYYNTDEVRERLKKIYDGESLIAEDATSIII